MKPTKTTLGKFMKQARESKGITQNDLAKKLGYASPQFVSNWERGLATPPRVSAKKICKILGIEKEAYIKVVVKAYKDDLEDSF